MRTHYFTWINAVMISLSIGCWLPALWGFSSIQPLQRTLTDMVELGPHLFKTPAFWLGVVILAPVMALLLDFILSSWLRQRQPLDRQIFQVENTGCLCRLMLSINEPRFTLGFSFRHTPVLFLFGIVLHLCHSIARPVVSVFVVLRCQMLLIPTWCGFPQRCTTDHRHGLQLCMHAQFCTTFAGVGTAGQGGCHSHREKRCEPFQ